ncbi:tetratricopeptide repeat protein [Sphingomonas sp. J315]|uniref:tetratricopeptide repeat protein n=1 Tax=Sphingomonas sp. J315 TaxID=2898433 RepID=UPI0021ADA784|nr:tetratricopeptide repeat protein [Sphingomonas sp. J315]UUY00608.1 tetratricopeptide repeat protein [Sphingomonas sp. J315]
MIYPLLLAAAALTIQDAEPAAVEVDVIQTSPEFDAAMDAGDARKALALIEPDTKACIAANGGDAATPEQQRPCILLVSSLAVVLGEAGRTAEAVAVARRAVAIGETFDGSTGMSTLANLTLGAALERLGRHGEAEPAFVAALASAEKILAGDPALATYIGRRANNLVMLGRHAEALPLARRAVEMAGDTIEGAVFRMMEGAALTRLGRLTEAEATLRISIARLSALMGPGASQTIRSREALAHCLEQQNRTQESVALWREAVAMRRAEGDSPDLADSLSGLSVLLVRTGEYREAEAAAREALAVRLRFFGEASNFTGLAYNNLGLVLLESGQIEAAAEMLGRSVEVIKASGVANIDEMIAILTNLATVLARLGETGQAIDVQRQVLSYAERAFGPAHARAVMARNNLAVALGAAGRRREAIPLLDANYAAAKSLGVQGQQIAVQSAGSLAAFADQEGDSAKARLWYARADADARAAFRPDHVQRILLGEAMVPF